MYTSTKQGVSILINEDLTDIENPAPDVSYDFSGYHFVWSSEKYKQNYQKHNLTFEEAATVIVDPYTEYYVDDEHSDDEDRFIAIGYSGKLRLLVVCHCLRDNDSTFRLFSARKATNIERESYENGD
jgi:uncharacterized DUF497 family protein